MIKNFELSEIGVHVVCRHYLRYVVPFFPLVCRLRVRCVKFLLGFFIFPGTEYFFNAPRRMAENVDFSNEGLVDREEWQELEFQFSTKTPSGNLVGKPMIDIFC